MIPRIKHAHARFILVAVGLCLVIGVIGTSAGSQSQAPLLQISNVPLVDFLSKILSSQSFKATKTNDIFEWMKWILNIGKGFMDPLYIGNLKLDVEEKAFTAHATGDAITVRNLLLSKISNLTVDNSKLGLSANMTFPKLGLQGVYNLTGRVNDLETDVFGRGMFRVILNDFKVYGAFRLSIGSKLVLKLQDLDYSLKSLDVNMDNIMGGGAVSDLLNGVVSDVGPIAADELKANVTMAVMDAVNKALENFVPQK